MTKTSLCSSSTGKKVHLSLDNIEMDDVCMRVDGILPPPLPPPPALPPVRPPLTLRPPARAVDLDRSSKLTFPNIPWQRVVR